LNAPGYRPVVTQIFDRTDKYCADDAVFAVKDSLIADFLPTKGNDKAEFELPYNFRMATYEDVHQNGAAGATEDSTVL
jgi:catechol 1,2-dioxygenase